MKVLVQPLKGSSEPDSDLRVRRPLGAPKRLSRAAHPVTRVRWHCRVGVRLRRKVTRGRSGASLQVRRPLGAHQRPSRAAHPVTRVRWHCRVVVRLRRKVTRGRSGGQPASAAATGGAPAAVSGGSPSDTCAVALSGRSAPTQEGDSRPLRGPACQPLQCGGTAVVSSGEIRVSSHAMALRTEVLSSSAPLRGNPSQRP